MKWYKIGTGVPDQNKLCLIRTITNNYHIAAYNVCGRAEYWLTDSNRVFEVFQVTHWTYITPPNE